jgi:hypothetical protein
MPDENDLDQPDYDDSSLLNDGDESNRSQEPPPDEGGEVVVDPAVVPAPVAAVVPTAPVTPPTPEPAPRPVHPGTVSPFAQGAVSPERRAALEQLFLPEQVDAIIGLSSDIAQMQVRAFEQTQDMARDLGVPSEYMRDVKAYGDRVPEQMRGTKEGAQAAVLLAMHDRATQGGNLIDEMARFVEAARPQAQVTPAKPAPAPPEALAPAARVTRSAVSGAAVAPRAAANGAGRKDPIETKMPWLKNYLDD